LADLPSTEFQPAASCPLGIFIALLALSGGISLISRLIPEDAGLAIVVWVGLVITVQPLLQCHLDISLRFIFHRLRIDRRFAAIRSPVRYSGQNG
jgi:hypothetical protein